MHDKISYPKHAILKRKTSISLEQLKDSACWNLNKHLFEEKKTRKHTVGGTVVTKVYPQISKEKLFIENALFEYTQKKGILLYSEYCFHPVRKWRFDWVILDYKIAFEYNGIMGNKSRHTTISGYNGDMDKLNAAQNAGFKVMQYTPLNYGSIVDYLGTI